MDVTLPDGTVIRGVPEGTTKEQLYAKLQKNGYDVSKLSPPKPLHGPELAQRREAEALDARRAEQAKPKPAPAAPPAPQRTMMDDAVSVANATGDALAPYATAAAAGGGAGALVGGVGAPFGALAGVTGLALGDVAAGGYNLVAPMFGGQPMTAPSEAIRNQFRGAGLTKQAEDPMGRVVFNALNTGAASIGGGEMMRMGGELLKKGPGIIGSVGNFFATPVTAASTFGAGVTGGAAQQTATEMGAPKPVADILGLVGSLPGGGMGDKLAGIKPTPPVPAASAAQLGARTAKSYDEAHLQGVEWTPDTVDYIADKAMKDAISPAHPDGPMPVSAVAPGVRDVLRGMADAAGANGRMDSRNLDFWRQKLGEVIGTLGGAERAVALRIREGLDSLTADPDYTINTLRSDVTNTRNVANNAQATAKAAGARAALAETDLENATTAWKAKPTPENAAARAKATADHAAAMKAADEADEAAGLATQQYESRQAVMHAQDPDMKEAAGLHAKAVERETSLSEAADKTFDAYTAKAEAHMTAEDALEKAKAALAAAEGKYGPNHVRTNTARAAARAAETRVTELEADVAAALGKYDRTAAQFDKAKAARVDANNKLTAREKALSPVDDTQARVSGRNEALADARRTFPTQKRTAAMEAMPEAASISAAGASGDMAAALRQQVRAFIRDQGEAGMRQLPEPTRRALDHFAAGGRLGQRTLELIGRLSPGGGSRHSLGNAFTAAQSGLGFLFGGGGGAIITPLAGAAATTAARGAANRGAENEFARLRDMVARGDSVKPKPSGNPGQKIVNYMLADALSGEPKR